MRVDSGVPGFDTLTGGGLPASRLYLLSGPPGSGKTTFAAQFVTAGVESGERALYISMHETAEALQRAMADYEFGFERALRSQRFRFLNVFDDQREQVLQPVEQGDYRTSLRNQIRRLEGFVADHGLDRLVVDSAMLLRYFYGDDDETFITFLTGLKQVDATVLLISEMTDPTAYSDDHYLAHGVVFLHNFIDPESGDMTRGIQVVKLRETAIDTDIHALRFTGAGVEVDPGRTVSV